MDLDLLIFEEDEEEVVNVTDVSDDEAEEMDVEELDLRPFDDDGEMETATKEEVNLTTCHKEEGDVIPVHLEDGLCPSSPLIGLEMELMLDFAMTDPHDVRTKVRKEEEDEPSSRCSRTTPVSQWEKLQGKRKATLATLRRRLPPGYQRWQWEKGSRRQKKKKKKTASSDATTQEAADPPKRNFPKQKGEMELRKNVCVRLAVSRIEERR